MTGPPMYPNPGSPQSPRQFAGRRRFGGGGFTSTTGSLGDGGAPNDGMLQQPQQPSGTFQPQRPRRATHQPPAPSGAQPTATSQPPQPQAGVQQAPRPTFAQMQEMGQARPAPPSINQFQGQLQGALSQNIAQPSRYGMPQVQQIDSALTAQLKQQFGAQQKQLDEEMARRGVLSSSIAGGNYGDLAGQHATALASMKAQLIQDAARTNAQDQSAALGAGQNYLTSQQTFGLGQGALGVQQQQADTSRQSVSNQYDLGQRQLGQQGYQFERGLGEQGRQFDIESELARILGVGNLGVAQQQANTQQAGTLGQLGIARDQLTQQGTQFERSMGEEGRQFDIQQQLAQALGLGGLDLQNRQLTQQGSQFQQQNDLARLLGLGNLEVDRGQLSLSRELGLGGLDVQKRQLQQQGTQFDRTLNLDALKNSQQYGLQTSAQNIQQQQFAQQLAQQLGLATMQDKTANRGVDANAALAQNDLMLKVANLLGSMGGFQGGTFGGTSTGGSGTGTTNTGGLATSDPRNSTVNFGGRTFSWAEWQAYTAAHPNYATEGLDPNWQWTPPNPTNTKPGNPGDNDTPTWITPPTGSNNTTPTTGGSTVGSTTSGLMPQPPAWIEDPAQREEWLRLMTKQQEWRNSPAGSEMSDSIAKRGPEAWEAVLRQGLSEEEQFRLNNMNTRQGGKDDGEWIGGKTTGVYSNEGEDTAPGWKGLLQMLMQGWNPNNRNGWNPLPGGGYNPAPSGYYPSWQTSQSW
jgi:hypothetical protein